jgi:hypothetical protein
MAQITLRGIDPEIERKIRMMAKKGKKSMNRVVLDIIYEHSGYDKKGNKPAADSLRKLAGGWSDEDALEFMESIRSCEQIDAEMWT